MSKKCITVPKTKEAEQRLDLDKATSDELLEYYFETDQDFYNLYQSKFFDEINQLCDSMIDDFESDELLDLDSKKKCLTYLEFKQKSVDTINYKIIDEIIKLVKESINRDTGLYFFF